MKSLPDKPSELLALAMIDLELVEQDSKYTVNMDRWHAPYRNSCYVCLAGSVMAKTLHTPRTEYYAPYYFDENVAFKLDALDALREGDVEEAMDMMNIAIPAPNNRDVTAYENDPSLFKQDMHNLIHELKEHGL